MPELPEVETVARQLAPRLTGRRVEGLRVYDPLLRRRATPRLTDRRIVAVARSGKRVLVEFSAGPRAAGPVWLAVHLRMTGRLIWSDRSPSRRADHLRARLALDRGALLFIDTRRFGTFSWYRDARDAEPHGLDPLSPEFTPRRLADLLRGARQNIKAWLLRQDRLVGLGNIYASEILHAARISPFNSASSLDRGEIGRLHAATRRILRRAIDSCGTTFSDFQDAYGLTGSYQRYLAVYEREDRPCRRCRAPVRRVTQQQRSTYYCPTCQE